MDECVPMHQLLVPENYIVQPVESIPISVIDYGKVEMTHLIHAGQFTNGVIQVADVNSNLKTKELHPLEAEIQRDLEVKQQHAADGKRQTSSVIQSPPQITQELLKKQKCSEATNSLFDGLMQFQAINGRESVLNVNPVKLQDSTIYQSSQVNRPMVFEKRQFIIVSDNSVLLNIVPKDEAKNMANDLDEAKKPEAAQTNSNINTEKLVKEGESDSENEEEEIEPVNDYEPDPDTTESIASDQKDKPNKCYMCFKSFRQKKNMYAHIRKIHSVQPKIEGGILCPLCKMHALRQEHLRNHLESLHEIRIEKEEKLFTTMEEFLEWKEYTERETLSFYVSKSSSKLLANNQQKTYYKCHRSGNYVTLKKETQKKKLKVQAKILIFDGSNKIGATCPAAIEVTENTHGINVIFWKTHVGHENNLEHLILNSEDKAKIMDYISSGVSWDKILEIVMKEESKGTSTPSQLTMVSKKDTRNMKNIQEMQNSPESISPRKKIIQGRKPIKEKMLRRAPQSLVIEKAVMLLNLLQATDVRPEFRPKICLMLDNLISTVKRRTIKSSRKENFCQKRRQCIRRNGSETADVKNTDQSTPVSDPGTDDFYMENLEFCNNLDKSFAKQTTNTRRTRKNSSREASSKKIISKCCH